MATCAPSHGHAARLFHKRAPTARVDYGDRVSRLIYSRFYFFKKHLSKDPLTLAAFVACVNRLSPTKSRLSRRGALRAESPRDHSSSNDRRTRDSRALPVTGATGPGDHRR